ncbi:MULTISPECIES: hypothetical protein [unclassified Beijerinckia]|uniref:alpha/beta fold hydrolase n=1 Tax=unclassified Beijerinckia TaxID=2638183 RepID=UPI000897A54C|nr:MULTISPECIES: hypothetical protein [unclassified Beijerinckia]MDH7796714.1 pimeloyl-ACP methyl ester carboxylesterase [Beijerinckia sp. GAS462]SEC56857.1 hypothetical protein SAMN05443249_2998 [Beijerinckia sp. 28-YEA-48]
MDTTVNATSSASTPLLCFGFADAAASPALKLIAAGRTVVSGAGSDQAATSAIIAKGAACGEALSFAAQYAGIVESVILIAPDDAAAQRAAALADDCKAQVLALAGTRDAESDAAATAIKKALPTCHLVYVFDTGKDMDEERPEALAKVARDFLTRRDKFLVSNADGRITP